MARHRARGSDDDAQDERRRDETALERQVHLRRHRAREPGRHQAPVDLVRIGLGQDLLGDVGDLLRERADDAVVHAAAGLDLALVASAVTLGFAQSDGDLALLDREAG